MATLIGEVISRIRNQVKAVRQDAGMTDRFFFSMVMKHAKLLMRRQDNYNRIMKFNSIFKALEYVELCEIDASQAECFGVHTTCKLKRTKDPLPKMIEGYWGALIRSVTSLDYSQEVKAIFPTTYQNLAKQKAFKYDKTKYYWYLDGYLYFPDCNWDAVRVEGVFEGDISKYNCNINDECLIMQYRTINVPEFLFSEIEQLVMRDLGVTMQIPQDNQSDNRNPVAQ